MPVMQRRAQDTRASLLDAARDVFAEVGFAHANVADVVARASSSVGSMYHHFGGKADLYLALYEAYEARQRDRAERAISEAAASGPADPVTLFAAGARAYLDGAWRERDLARMFLSGDHPPGFDHAARPDFLVWLRHASGLGRPAGRAAARAQSLVLTTAIAAGAREITGEPDEAQAMALAHEVITVVTRLAAGQAHPAGV